MVCDMPVYRHLYSDESFRLGTNLHADVSACSVVGRYKSKLQFEPPPL